MPESDSKKIKLKIKEIRGEWDIVPMEHLLEDWGKTYDWKSLIDDIKENGLKELIEVANCEGTWIVLDGHHRIRVFKHLNSLNTEIEVIQKPTPCNQ